MNEKEYSIDFVLPWVDGSDPEWQQQKKRTVSEFEDDRIERYRDWDLLRYWFRGLELFTPWVNRIHFVTWGHLPEWLNTQHPKLNIVRHEDYIPAKYRPTFSANPIELNIHQIPELSEHFVYFNDDCFILRPLPKTCFFQDGLPCDSALMNPIATEDLCKTANGGKIFYIPYNDVQYLNRDYNMRKVTLSNFKKWYNTKYGSYLIRNILLSAWPRFVGFVDLHLPQPFLKESFNEAWEQDGDILDETCQHAVRNDHDVNQWLIRYRQLAEGKFVPVKPDGHASFQLGNDNDIIYECIQKQQKPIICINDGAQLDYMTVKADLHRSFELILPNPSTFEII